MSQKANTILSPEGVSRSTVEEEAPSLAPLLDRQPSMLIYTRSSPAFEELRGIFNTNVTLQPLAIVRPRTEEEVSVVVSICSSQSPPIPLAIRSGGHDMWGRCLAEDGVVIDIRALDHVDLASDKKSARIGGGIRGGLLAKLLDEQDLTTPTGFCTTVGYAGWALGGGYGVLQGKYGLGCDQILAARVVTGSGAVVDTKDDPELLWALRGAGNGNFGVVVELTIKIYPRPTMLGGYLGYPMAEAHSVLIGFRHSLEESFPDEFSGDFLVSEIPGLGAVFMVLYTWVQEGSDLTEARTHLEKFSQIGNLLMNTVSETTPSGFATSLDPVTTALHPRYFRTRTIANITPELAKVFQENPVPPGACNVICHYAHGVALRPNPGASFAQRSSHIVLGISGSPPPHCPGDGPEMATCVDWVDTIVGHIKERGLALDSAYMNFSPPDECDTELFYGKEKTQRFKALKEKYDDGNVFYKAYPPLH
ncbi:FAD-binding domain-containing protein [Thozetella sp. PMI_491]|nr:FAD-binding domain-containing protein [Thozetella sp. PMI_491]